MGQAILYCFRCSTQLRESHFEQGKAFRIDAHVCCSACAPEAMKSLPPPLADELLKQISTQRPRLSSSSTSTPILRSATPRHAVPAAGASRARPAATKNTWIVLGVTGPIVLVVLGVALFSRSSGEAPPDRTPPVSNGVPKAHPPGSPPGTSPPSSGSGTPDTPARQALANARKYAREHPDDLFGQLREFEDLTLQADSGEAGQEARKEVQSLRIRGKEAVGRTMDRLNQEVSAALGRQEFGPVFDALEAGKARLEWPEWKLAVDARLREVQSQMDALYGPLKAKALEAKAKGDGAGVDAVVAQIRRWGSQRLAGDLSEALDTVSGPPVRIPLQDFETDAKGWGFVGGQEFPGAKGAFKAYLGPLWKTNWFVYAKRPFAGPEQVLAYLSRYTHRVAISNSRLISADQSGVTFKYKDYRLEGPERYKTMTLEPGEFIRRFLLHVLPKGFHRIRHYGLLANGAITRAEKLARARQLIAAAPRVGPPQLSHSGLSADLPLSPEIDHPCPQCGSRMVIIEMFGEGATPRHRPSPPVASINTS